MYGNVLITQLEHNGLLYLLNKNRYTDRWHNIDDDKNVIILWATDGSEEDY